MTRLHLGSRLASQMFLGLTLGVVACSASDDTGKNEQAAKPGSDTGASDASDASDGGDGGGSGGNPETLNTFLGANKYLQIDEAASGPPADADLFANFGGIPGVDPADGSPSRNYPCPIVGACPGTKEWIDWEDLFSDIGNHRILDADFGGVDQSAFPRSDSCVGPANVLTKMDLGYVGAANNNDYVYLDVLRRGNNGDAGYVWLFTKLKPPFEPNTTACRQGEKLLQYNISKDDVLVFGHFVGNGEPLLTVYKAKMNSVGPLNAVDAIDFNNGALWGVNAGAVAAVAINTTATAAGRWGTGGSNQTSTLDGGIALEKELFAEAAVTTATFTGGNSVCGQFFWASVITRSSGSGATNPDVKDLSVPTRFNFGSAQATATATPTCDGTVVLDVTATTDGETPIANPVCQWFDVKKITSSDAGVPDSDSDAGTTEIETAITTAGTDKCDITVALTGTAPLEYGEHTFRVKVSDGQGCNATPVEVTFAAWPKPTATADLSATCKSPLEINYTGGSSGVVGTASYAWTFTKTSDGSAAGTSTTQNGSFTPGLANTDYTGSLVVTDTRRDGKGGNLTCPSDAVTATDKAFAPLTLSLTNSAAPLMCSTSNPHADIGDAVTFTANISNGLPPYKIVWTQCTNPADEGTCSVTESCADQTTCVIDPAATDTCDLRTIRVAVTDSSPLDASENHLCAGKSDGPKTYRKITTITVE